MDGSSLPPVKRRPVPVPPPPPDAGGAAGASISPADGAPPVAAPEGMAGLIAHQIKAPPLSPPGGAMTAGTVAASRRAAAFPAWGWAVLGLAAVVSAGAAVVFVKYGPWAADRSTAADDPAKTAKTAKTRELTPEEMDNLNVSHPTKKPADKKTAAAKTGDGKTAAKTAASSSEPSKTGVAEPSAKKPRTPRGGPPGELDVPKPKIAVSLEEAKEAVVRFENPGFGGQRTPGALGFLIDGRGWIATNLAAVADATTATRAVLANGVSCELAGVVAKDPKYGLAILKLHERPLQMTVVELAAEGPRADDRGFLVGHPFNADFAFAPASIVAVLNSTDLPLGVRQAAGGQDAPRDASWVQITAKTSTSAAGCPLLNDRGKVLGINRAGSVQDERGYALHVRHLRALADTASEDVTPLPKGEPADDDLAGPRRPRPPREPEPPAVEPDAAPAAPDERVELSQPRMKELYEQAVAAGWKPQRAAQYAPIAGLARLMSFAKVQKDQAGTRLDLLPQGIQDAVSYADEIAQTLRKTEFDAEQVRAINRFAAGQLEQPNAGAMLFANVLQTIRDQQGKDAVIAEVSGTQKLVGVFLPADAPPAPNGTRLLVLAVVRPNGAEVQDQAGNKQRISLLQANYLLPIK